MVDRQEVVIGDAATHGSQQPAWTGKARQAGGPIFRLCWRPCPETGTMRGGKAGSSIPIGRAFLVEDQLQFAEMPCRLRHRIIVHLDADLLSHSVGQHA